MRREAVSWLRPVDSTAIHLSVITLGEVRRGITLKAKDDPRAAADLSAWPGMLRNDHADHILPITDRIAVERAA